MLNNKYICVVPAVGITFGQMVSEKSSYYEEGESENPFSEVVRQLESKNIYLIEKDDLPKFKEEKIACILHFNIDYELMSKHRNAINMYVAAEPACVDFTHYEYRLEKLSTYFDYTLTWNDNLIDLNGFIKFNYPIDFKIRKEKREFEDRKLVTNISANKKSPHPDELYSERYRAICYFDQFEPDFEFYGNGWDKLEFRSYRGITSSKRSTLAKYKFSICFENQTKTKGYITEKIWDCLLCGTIPIYWGADNVKEYIPENCFIDFREYSTIEDLHNTIVSMPKKEWEEYINNIEVFLAKSKNGPFSVESFSHVLESVLNKEKRVKINVWKIICIRWIKTTSRMMSAYYNHGVIGIYKKCKNKVFGV